MGRAHVYRCITGFGFSNMAWRSSFAPISQDSKCLQTARVLIGSVLSTVLNPYNSMFARSLMNVPNAVDNFVLSVWRCVSRGISTVIVVFGNVRPRVVVLAIRSQITPGGLRDMTRGLCWLSVKDIHMVVDFWLSFVLTLNLTRGILVFLMRSTVTMVPVRVVSGV